MVQPSATTSLQKWVAENLRFSTTEPPFSKAAPSAQSPPVAW
jgi:hypothetical protein